MRYCGDQEDTERSFWSFDSFDSFDSIRGPTSVSQPAILLLRVTPDASEEMIEPP